MAESSFTDDIITISSSDNTLDTISPITIDLGQYTGSAGATARSEERRVGKEC